jgi:hypothetical protein
MTVSDYINIGMIALSAVVLGAGIINRQAVANHNDRLARLTSAAGNVAGVIREQLNALPAGADVATVRNALIASAVPALTTEFATTLAKIDGTPEKVAGIVAGQLGQIPAVVVQQGTVNPFVSAPPPVAAA